MFLGLTWSGEAGIGVCFGPSIFIVKEIVREGRKKVLVVIEGELQGEDCLLHPGRGLHTLKPDATRLQRREVHYGLNSRIQMAYLEICQAHLS